MGSSTKVSNALMLAREGWLASQDQEAAPDHSDLFRLEHRHGAPPQAGASKAQAKAEYPNN